MAAVRVPPSAWITSQSMEICRSPSLGRSTTARSARPIRRWISCVRPEGWPTVDLAPRALGGGARQHAVLGRHPAAPLALEPRRHALLQARRAVDVGVAELDQAGALGVHRHRALDRDAAKLVGLAFGGTHGGARCSIVIRRHSRRRARLARDDRVEADACELSENRNSRALSRQTRSGARAPTGDERETLLPFDGAAALTARLGARATAHQPRNEHRQTVQPRPPRAASPSCRSSTNAPAPFSGRSSRPIWRPAIPSARAIWRAICP